MERVKLVSGSSTAHSGIRLHGAESQGGYGKTRVIYYR